MHGGHFGAKDSFKKNVEIEYERNNERYAFLRWGQQAFANFRVVPPGTGICHQVNLEYLAQTVWTRKAKEGKKTVEMAYPDTVVGTDCHTTMINGLARAGLGRRRHRSRSRDAGPADLHADSGSHRFRLTGKLREGVTATDLVLTVTQMLRKKGVVGKFVEFYGPGLTEMSLEDRATIGNMAPEYGATCGFFPVDAETVRYLKNHTGAPMPAHRAGGEIRQGAGHLRIQEGGRAGLHRYAGARFVDRRTSPGRPEAAAGSRGVVEGWRRIRRAL